MLDVDDTLASAARAFNAGEREAANQPATPRLSGASYSLVNLSKADHERTLHPIWIYRASPLYSPARWRAALWTLTPFPKSQTAPGGKFIESLLCAGYFFISACVIPLVLIVLADILIFATSASSSGRSANTGSRPRAAFFGLLATVIAQTQQVEIGFKDYVAIGFAIGCACFLAWRGDGVETERCRGFPQHGRGTCGKGTC